MLAKIKQNPIQYVRKLALIGVVSELVYDIINRTIQLANSKAQAGAYIFVCISLLIGYIPYALFLRYLYSKHEINPNSLMLSVFYLITAVVSAWAINTSAVSLQAFLKEFPLSFSALPNSYMVFRSMGAVIRYSIITIISAFLCVDVFRGFKLVRISRALLYVRLVLTVLLAFFRVFDTLSGLSRPTFIVDAMRSGSAVIVILAYALVILPHIAQIFGALAQLLLWKYCLGTSEPENVKE